MYDSLGLVLLACLLGVQETLSRGTHTNQGSDNPSNLDPWGRNVVTQFVTIYALQSRRVRVPYYTMTCSKTRHCWYCKKRRVCRQLLRYRYTWSDSIVTKTKPVARCMSGWKQQGSECTIPICQNGCSHNGVCYKPGVCGCYPGWTGSICRQNINECAHNNGGCEHHCIDTVGSFRCACNDGYYRTLRGQCYDINECRQSAWPTLCQQKCVNTPGSYQCACHRGYRLNADGKLCTALIDECKINNGGCFHKCVNTNDSYYCTCPEGYTLAPNGKDCADRNECKSTTGHVCQQLCVNEPGDYSCACYRGYTLDANNYTCSDMDECVRGTAGCSHTCNNTVGSFKCFCRPGYVLGQDKQTCFDVDECLFGQHSCDQICVNTIGSYDCTCRPGFALTADRRRCRAKYCSFMRPLLRGYMNCSGFSTGDLCRFSCFDGYELVGSSTRVCRPDQSWSGSTPSCRAKQCDDLAPPDNGFVNLPCLTSHNSRCTVGCLQGFYLNGSAETTCLAGRGWTPVPGRCQAIQVCRPNPCQNGGRCLPLSSTDSTCNCTSTGFHGTFCNVGFVETPEYPRLRVDQNVTLTYKFSPSRDNVTFTFEADGVSFTPKSVFVSYDKNAPSDLFEVNVTVTAVTPGVHDVSYRFSGPGANVYEPAFPDVVIVNDSSIECGQDSSSIPPSCNRLDLKTCPRTGDVIFAQSSSVWNVTNSAFATKGVTILKSSNIAVPLALKGTSIPSSTNPSAVPFKIPGCQSSPDATLDLQCLPPSFLASSFLSAINHTLPSWFRITPSNNRSTVETTDFITYFLTGEALKQTVGGLQLQIDESSYYAVLLYTGPSSITLNNNSVSLPDYGKGNYLTVVINLCSRRGESNAMVAFNPPSLSQLKSLQFIRDLRQLGWEVNILGFQTSLTSPLSNYFRSLDAWNGTAVQRVNAPAGNLEVFGGSRNFIQGVRFSRGTVEFVGNAILSFPDFENALSARNPRRSEWRAQIKGSFKLSLRSVVRGRAIDITDALTKDVIGYVTTHYADVPGWCNKGNQLAAFFNGTIVKGPFKSTVLQDYIALSPNTNANYFIDSQLVETYGDPLVPAPTLVLGIQAKGNAKYGPLRLHDTKLDFVLRDVDSFRVVKQCRVGDSLLGSVSGVTIVGKFDNVTQLGRFFTVDPKQGHFFKIVIPSLDPDVLFNMKSSAQFLGEVFPVTLSLDSERDMLRFYRNGTAFGKFAVFYNASSPLRDWDSLQFRLTGEFPTAKEASHRRSLPAELEQLIGDYIREVSMNTERRLQMSSSEVIRARRRFALANEKLNRSEHAYAAAFQRYSVALKEKNKAAVELQSANKLFVNASAEFNESREELEGLCTIENCPLKCISGMNCTMCVKTVFTKVRGLCPSTCYERRLRRVAPFGYWTICTRHRCSKRRRSRRHPYSRKHYHRRNVRCYFRGTIFRNWVVRRARRPRHWQTTVTGLPPGVSDGISRGSTSFAESRNMGLSMNSRLYSRKSSRSHARHGYAQDSCRVVPEVSDHYNCWKQNYFCYKPVYNYKTSTMPYPCQVECEKEVVNGTITTPCCTESRCHRRVVDTECVKRNALCRIMREKVMSKYNKTKQRLIEPYRKAQEARFNFSLAEIRFQKASLELALAGGRRRMLRNTVIALNSAMLIAERAYGNLRRRFDDAAQLREAWIVADGANVINVTQASFDVTVNSNRVSVIPYNITAASGNQKRVLSAILDFDKDRNSLWRTAGKIIEAFFGDVSVALPATHPYSVHMSRARRAVDSASDNLIPLIDYKRKCSQFTNYERTLREITGSLHRLATEIIALYQKFSGMENTKSGSELDDSLLNQAIVTKLGISAADLQSARADATTDQTVRESASISELESLANKEQLQLSMELMYRDWFASMERLFNSTNADCIGFSDCLVDMLDNLYHLFDGVDLPQTPTLKARLSKVKVLLIEIIGKDDLTVLDAISQTEEVLRILDKTKESKIFCTLVPNITQQPAAFTEVRVGETLTLSCEASGDLFPSYKWMKNGIVLTGAGSTILVLKNVKQADTGIYTCKVSNHVGSQESVPARVVVHAPPTLTQEPPSRVAEVVNALVTLVCNATSTVQPLNYSWYFKPSKSKKSSLIQTAIFPVLQITPLNKESAGWYHCNVSNQYGYSVSRASHVTALDFSLARPTIQAQVYVTVETKRLVSALRPQRLNLPTKSRDVEFSSHAEDAINRELARSAQDVLIPLAKLSHDAISDFSVSGCRLINKNITCKTTFAIRGFNVTEKNTMEHSLETNSMKVLEAVNKLQVAVKSIVTTSQNRPLVLPFKEALFTLNSDSWEVGQLEPVCPQVQRLRNNQFICVNCPPGTHVRGNVNGGECLLCDIGTYQPFQGQTDCLKCPDGFTNHETGHIEVSSCQITPGATGLPGGPRTTQNPDVTTPKEDVDEGNTAAQQAHGWKVAVGVVVPLVIIIVIGIAVYLYLKRRRSSHKPTTLSQDDTGTHRSTFSNPVFESLGKKDQCERPIMCKDSIRYAVLAHQSPQIEDKEMDYKPDTGKI